MDVELVVLLLKGIVCYLFSEELTVCEVNELFVLKCIHKDELTDAGERDVLGLSHCLNHIFL